MPVGGVYEIIKRLQAKKEKGFAFNASE